MYRNNNYEDIVKSLMINSANDCICLFIFFGACLSHDIFYVLRIFYCVCLDLCATNSCEMNVTASFSKINDYIRLFAT